MSRHKSLDLPDSPSPLISFPLAAAITPTLPASLGEGIADGPTPEAIPRNWTLVGTADPEMADLLRRVLLCLSPIAAMHRRKLTEHNIELLVRSILPDVPRPDVWAELERDNARMRADYLRETRMLTAAEVRDASGLDPKNRSEPASRWKRERRIFAVRHGGRDLYPSFQFEDGQPRPAIKDILREIPASATQWQVALWFASGNGWLDGAAPQTRLHEARKVVEAAKRLASGAEG